MSANNIKEMLKQGGINMKKGKVDALLGIVFGDEGKGKVVDVFTPEYDVVARFAGGPNAGHTIIFEGQKFVLRSIPSGIFAKDKVNIIGNGCVTCSWPKPRNWRPQDTT